MFRVTISAGTGLSASSLPLTIAGSNKMCYRRKMGPDFVWLALTASIKDVSMAGAFSVQVYIDPDNRIFGYTQLLQGCRGAYLFIFIHSKQTSSFVPLLCPSKALPCDTGRIWLQLRGRCPAVTVADSAEAAHAGRPLTGRKHKGMIYQKNCQWDHICYSSVAGAHPDHVINSSNCRNRSQIFIILGIYNLVFDLLISEARKKAKISSCMQHLGLVQDPPPAAVLALYSGAQQIQLVPQKSKSRRGVLSLKHHFGHSKHSNHFGSTMLSGNKLNLTVPWIFPCYSLIIL